MIITPYHVTCSNFPLARTNQRSNTNVHIVKIGSRTKMKQSAIRTLYISVDILGPVWLYPGTGLLFTVPRLALLKQIRVDIVGMSLPAQGLVQPVLMVKSRQIAIGR